jgi:hypothetical protein
MAMTADQKACYDSLIAQVQQEITSSCQIPFTIPKEEIIRIINNAKMWFYKHYEYSVQEKYYALKAATFQTETFRKTGEVTMPDSVFAVNSVYQIGGFAGEDGGFGGQSFTGLDPDFALDKFIYNNLYGSGIGSEQMMYYVINAYFVDVARFNLQAMISYNYNFLNKKFRFMGELPTGDVIFMIFEKISDCALFSDEIFIRYIVAQVKKQLGRVLGTFTFNLPGNIQINYADIKSEGVDELKEIEEEIKDDEGTDYFFTD